MKSHVAAFRHVTLLMLTLAGALLASRADAQSTTDQPSGYGRTLTVVQAASPGFGASLDLPSWWATTMGVRLSGVGSRRTENSLRTGQGPARIGSVVRSGERGSKWRSPSLASARTANR